MRMTVNGVPVDTDVDPDTPLLYVLRNDLGLKATRFGCGAGECGACLVLVDGAPVPSCTTPLWDVEGKAVTTVEGLSSYPVQDALLAEQAAQCGYCTGWDTYPILRFSDVPRVHVELVDRPDLPSLGAGEAAQGPTAAAIASAVKGALGTPSVLRAPFMAFLCAFRMVGASTVRRHG